MRRRFHHGLKYKRTTFGALYWVVGRRSNRSRPRNWWALVTNNGEFNGRPLNQTDTDPAPGFYISTTSLEDPNCDRKDPRRYVNAEAVNFIVLPGRVGLGAKLGDFAVVIRPATRDYDYAVYADVGPASKIGEGSIALANTLGIPSSPKTGGTGHGIVYIVFPGTQARWPLTQPEIDQYGAQLFAKWGGVDKGKRLLPKFGVEFVGGSLRISAKGTVSARLEHKSKSSNFGPKRTRSQILVPLDCDRGKATSVPRSPTCRLCDKGRMADLALRPPCCRSPNLPARRY